MGVSVYKGRYIGCISVGFSPKPFGEKDGEKGSFLRHTAVPSTYGVWSGGYPHIWGWEKDMKFEQKAEFSPIRLIYPQFSASYPQ